MKKVLTSLFFGLFVVSILTSVNCSNQQSNEFLLTAKEYSKKIESMPNAPIIDVRTPEEFKTGHIAKAVNYNWNGDKFLSQIAKLDKTKPVFVYCHAGGRSNAAANKMRSIGFKKVYDLSGGFTSWKAASLPVKM